MSLMITEQVQYCRYVASCFCDPGIFCFYDGIQPMTKFAVLIEYNTWFFC
jgi:hypothetical protein